MKPKMRIRLLDENLIPLSDRLVDQQIELYQGPKDQHKGPISLELVLTNKDDINSFKTYLDQLTGDLPISSKKYKTKPSELPMESEHPYEDLLKEAIKKGKNQVVLMDFLREMNFRFITFQHLQELIVFKGWQDFFKLEEAHKKYQFMIRLIKEAKDPVNDKYDPQLIFGIKINGKHINKVKVYLYGNYLQSIIAPWPEKHGINFKKPEIMWKFPDYMTLEERKKWRSEWAKLQKNPDLKPSKFYERWQPHIINLLEKKAKK